MTPDTIQRSDALEYVLENYPNQVREIILSEIRQEIDDRIETAEYKRLDTNPINNPNYYQFLCKEIEKYNEFLELLK